MESTFSKTKKKRGHWGLTKDINCLGVIEVALLTGDAHVWDISPDDFLGISKRRIEKT